MDTDHISKNNYGNWEQAQQVAPVTEPSAYIARYMTGVYGWMFLGLGVTTLVAFLVASSEAAVSFLFGNRLALFGMIILQVLVAGALIVRIQKMSAAVAGMVFLFYAALVGLTFSGILLTFTAGSLVVVFSITAGTFGIMTAVGYFTRQDLTSFGRIMMMGLIGILLASVVNFFLGSSTLYWIISYVGVAVFVGLIAYDTQKIKEMALLDNAEDRKRGAVMGALMLYLDFVNLFMFLLRLFGDRRN